MKYTALKKQCQAFSQNIFYFFEKYCNNANCKI
uniref:Uncharacterized protein n=1 Tax=Siphoviridae sp. ct3q24 TaxID=2827772 RepID=A0A8S5SEE0_9CAUD|nr:MAG TPA: hypothetical protein [Siphoviridae sp. ct3q24]DAL94851.1 MAG TPA: hypothetical protein [Caudoviricetes sp.]